MKFQATISKDEFIVERDRVWKFFKNYSIDYFKSQASEIKFKKEVSKDVVKRFDLVKKLIFYSYYEYDFLDVAFERALSTFEMALKIRYKEINKVGAGKKELDELINWADSIALFEFPKKNIHKIREHRNDFVGHIKKYSSGGIVHLNYIYLLVSIINGLYEDVELRKERKRISRKITNSLKFIDSEGAIIEIDGKRLIVFLGKLVWFENRDLDYKYHFIFYPIFNPKFKDKDLKLPDPIFVEANNWKSAEGSFYLEIQNKKIKVSKIHKAQNIEKFSNWKKDFTKNNRIILATLSNQIGNFKSILMYKDKYRI
jgi:hypothetical protein